MAGTKVLKKKANSHPTEKGPSRVVGFLGILCSSTRAETGYPLLATDLANNENERTVLHLLQLSKHQRPGLIARPLVFGALVGLEGKGRSWSPIFSLYCHIPPKFVTEGLDASGET
jgi:hypothetical protein